jgi:methylated-DNA-[protein]-cysteine S-methyltransferase
MEILGKTYYETPLGLVEIQATYRGIYALNFVEKAGEEINPAHPHLQQCLEELEEYFQGERLVFSLMLDIVGTDFQVKVWRELLNIPFAETQTYLGVAKRIKSPEAVRAVGNACARNRLWLLVPCHRVLSSDGKLTGYAGGLARKRWLLEHERGVLFGRQTLLFSDNQAS